MSSKTSEDILGFEYDWLAVDKDGYIGLFSTAGGGRAPEAFLADTDAHDAGLEALMAAPRTTPPRFYREIKPGLDNAWKEAAERGVFAFDSDPHGGPYRLVAAPQSPIRLAEAPGPTADAASRVKLDQLNFLDVEQGGTINLAS